MSHTVEGRASRELALSAVEGSSRAGTPGSPPFSPNLLQVQEADSKTLHGGKVARIALDKQMLYTVLLRRRENLLPVNGPAPDFGEMFRRRVLHLCGWESGLAIL